MTSVVLRTKYLRNRARLDEWKRPRPKTCFAVFGINPPFTPESFDLARKQWISMARDYRTQQATDAEKTANIAWQHLKNWQCPVCRGLKRRTKTQTCGKICGDKLGKQTRAQRLGPIVVRLGKSRYRGHALRRAQVTTLRNALEKCGHCVADTAKELGMSYSTLKYYIRKFGGYVEGQR